MSVGASEFFDLAADIEKEAVDVAPVLRTVIQVGMAEMKDAWKQAARESSGVHGKWYPESITYETRILATEIYGEVGPDSGKLQGSMGRGFEYGSRNQPPHLDGLRTIETAAPALEARFSTALGFLL